MLKQFFISRKNKKTMQNSAENNAALDAALHKYRKAARVDAETFGERLSGSVNAAEIISYLCQLIDATLCGLGVYVVTLSLTSNVYISVAFAVSIAGVFELLKRYFYPLAARHIVQGWLVSSRYYLSFIFCLGLAVLGFVGSYVFAVDGIEKTVKYVRNHTAPPAVVPDSVATAFIDAAILQKQKELAAYEYGLNGVDWNITNILYPELSNDLDLLGNKRDSILEANKQNNETNFNKWVEKGTQTGSAFWWLGLLTLLAFVVIRYYIEYYYKQALAERPEWIERLTKTTPNNFNFKSNPKTKTSENNKKQRENNKKETKTSENNPKTKTDQNEDHGARQYTPEELRKLATTARTYYKRGVGSSKPETRRTNAEKAQKLIKELRNAGAQVEEMPNTLKVIL